MLLPLTTTMQQAWCSFRLVSSQPGACVKLTAFLCFHEAFSIAAHDMLPDNCERQFVHDYIIVIIHGLDK